MVVGIMTRKAHSSPPGTGTEPQHEVICRQKLHVRQRLKLIHYIVPTSTYQDFVAPPLSHHTLHRPVPHRCPASVAISMPVASCPLSLHSSCCWEGVTIASGVATGSCCCWPPGGCR
jgi:hypothetical protein